jgi:hypothetical protein
MINYRVLDPYRTFVWVEPPAARPEKPGARCPCPAGLPRDGPQMVTAPPAILIVPAKELISDAGLARAGYSSGRLRLIRGAFCGMLDDAHSRSNAVTLRSKYADPSLIAYPPLRMVCRMAAAAGANAIEPDYGGSPPVPSANKFRPHLV